MLRAMRLAGLRLPFSGLGLPALLAISACGFSGSSGNPGNLDEDAGSGSDASTQPDANTNKDGGSGAKGRRIVLTIAGSKVTENLVDFPVYVDVTNAELRTQLDLNQISFRRRNGAVVESLSYEIQSFEKPMGRLRAWVRLPLLTNTAENTFELQYGDASVAVLPNPAEVWRNGYRAVFHLESAGNPIADSRGTFPGTPANLQPNAARDAKVGRGIGFDNNINGVISLANPITGSGPSTISVWVRPLEPINKEAMVVMGAGQPNQARWLQAQFNEDQVGVGLYENDWTNTGLDLVEQQWTLVHWTYNNQVSRLYQNAQLVGSYTHTSAANTQGTEAWIGNSKTQGFDNDAGMNGTLDEVRISNVERSAAWIAAEHANQNTPADFLTVAAPQANQ